MNIRLPRTSILLVSAVAAVVFMSASGCGFKTRPLPPEETSPVMQGTVALERTEAGIRLVWQRASHNADGSGLDDLAGFMVERLDGEPTAGQDWKVIAQVEVTDNEKFGRLKKFSWTDPQPFNDGPSSYRIRAFNGDSQSGPPTPPALLSGPSLTDDGS